MNNISNQDLLEIENKIINDIKLTEFQLRYLQRRLRLLESKNRNQKLERNTLFRKLRR